ncbi:MAG: flavodoxin family protein [Bacillota bacterium]
MAHILGISGSPKDGATEYSVKYALSEAAKVPGITTEFVTLRTLKFNLCTDCCACIKTDKTNCTAFHDDFSVLYERFLKADGYLIGSPVYQMNISALLAAFFNRFRPLWTITKRDPHSLGRKVGGGIAVGGKRNGGEEMALLAIVNFFFTNGIIPVSGGVLAYNGAAIWSQNKGAEGAAADEVGMGTVRTIAQRVALVTLMAKAGEGAYLDGLARLKS